MQFRFRGRDINGHYDYGRYLTQKKIRHNKTISDAIIIDSGDIIPVSHVALLIGYDMDGNEIYSDDEVIDSAGNKHHASEYFCLKYDVRVIKTQCR